MKKITFLIICVLLVISTSKAFAYDHLYVVGNACPAGWDTGAAPEMTVTEPGIFTWTGTLSDNTGDGGQRRFKFLTERSWSTSLTCQITTPGHKIITSGVEEDLFVRTSSGADNAFQVSETAVYTIVVNTNTMKMTCTKEGELPGDTPDLTQLYIVGDATTAGWDPNTALEMTRTENAVFSWVGNFNAEGQFKFLNQRGSWNKTINPLLNDVNIEPGVEYDLSFRANEDSPNDFKFKITQAGMYVVSVNLNSMKLVVTAASPDLNQLYVVGSATSAGWDNQNALEMTKIQDGVFNWSGELNAEGEFKFLNERGSWNKTINPLEDEIYFFIDNQYSLNYRPLEASPNDYKFKISTTGYYNLSVNLIEMKMLIQLSSGLENKNNIDFSKILIHHNNSIILNNNGNEQIYSAEIFDISGKCLNKVFNVMNDVTILAENLSKGIYIVKLNIDNQNYVQKISIL